VFSGGETMASPIGNVEDIITHNSTKSTTKDISKTLGKDDFLKILITQLQHQDPSQPLEDKEFIAQMAQFTSLEQLSNMNTEMKALRQTMGLSPAFIGKQISWSKQDSLGNEVINNGLVDGLKYKDGIQYATVGEEEVSLDQIVKVTNPE
jgi:flagellar basal-body rod modification protein FlgD